MRPQQPFKRVDRVADVIRQIVSSALMTKVHHLGLEAVTVTDVTVSPDLRHAKVFFTVMDAARLQQAKRALGAIKSLIQKEVASQMATRNTPHLRFVYDESLEYGNHIDRLLNKIGSEHVPESDGEE